MPRIPLADIPNAPAPVQQGPGNIGSLGQVNLAGIGRQYQRSLLQQGSFDGPAKGLQAIGQAGGEIAGMLGKIAQAKAEAEADTAAIEAGNRMQVEFADYTSKLTPSTPTDEFVSGWQFRFSQVKQEVLGDQKLSPLARQKIERSALKLEGESIANLTTAANREVFKRSLNAHEQLFEQAKSRGDWAGAGEVIRVARGKGLYSDETANAMAEGVASEADLYTAKSAIDRDPIMALSSLEDSNQFNKLTIRNREQLKDEAGRAINRKKSGLMDLVSSAVESNRINSQQDAESIFGEYLDDKTKMDIEVMLSKKVGPSDELRHEILDSIDGLDVAADVRGDAAHRISQIIKSRVPEGYKQELLDRLQKKVGPKTPSSAVESFARGILRDAKDEGLFGQTHEDFFKKQTEGIPSETKFDRFIPGKSKAEKYKEKSDERSKTLKAYGQVSDALDEFFKRKPNAGREEAQAEVQRLIGRMGANTTGKQIFQAPTKSGGDTMKKVKGVLGGTPNPEDVFEPLPEGNAGNASPGALIPELNARKKDR